MKEIPSYKDSLDLLRLNENDLEKIERLSRLLLEQDKVVRQDTEERENLMLEDEDFENLLTTTVKEQEEMEERIREREKDSNRPRLKIPSAFMLSEEARRERISAIKETLNILFPGKTEEIDDLESRELLGLFNDFCEKYVNERCEAGSWEKLDSLQGVAFEACDACFTTSQEGSGTSSERSKKDSKYDSIYYLYALSNGTCISQRFKRNKMLTGGLSGVVHPVAPLALFTGQGVDGLQLKAGSYDSSEVSAVPVLGHDLYEYFRKGFNASLRDPDQELQIPDTVKVLENGVEIMRNMTLEEGVYSDIHDGTAVNRILK